MNARTGSKHDYTYSDPFLPILLPTSEFIAMCEHNSADTSSKTQSRYLIELYIGANLSILNGRHKDDSPRTAIHQEAQV